jgi:crotonobetainyl-CoA:carnitine CoA-transferase CaiB-like acyl-CoA transferase
MSGIMKAQGGDSDPVFFTVPVNDVAGSASLAFGTILALFHRERTGVPQKVTTSLAAMACLLQTEALVRYHGRPAAKRGSRDHVGPNALERFYGASDGWFRLHASRVDDVDMRLNKIGVEATEDVEAAIATWASSLSRDEALTRLYGAGIPAVAARRISEIAADVYVHEHGLLHPDPRPDRDGCTTGRHAHFSRSMRTGALESPRLGQHTKEVFAEIGYSPADIENLIAGGTALADGS